VTEPFDPADVATGLFDALHLLSRLADDLAAVAGKAGLVPTDEAASLFSLADEVQVQAVVIHQRLRRIALIKAQGNGGVLLSPTGDVGWRATKPQGRFSVGGIVRMTEAELKEATRAEG
jgi:hypothetical protein